MNERLKQQLDFILEIDKEKNILRQTHLSGHGRRENDAEHAWHMAIMAYLLKEYANEEVDIAKVMLMCLIHDMGEAITGDIPAFEKTDKDRKVENKKVEQLTDILPEPVRAEWKTLFEEMEAMGYDLTDYKEALAEKIGGATKEEVEAARAEALVSDRSVKKGAIVNAEETQSTAAKAQDDDYDPAQHVMRACGEVDGRPNCNHECWACMRTHCPYRDKNAKRPEGR